MERPKKVNVSFLLLTLLFILTQTAFVLSATLSYDGLTENVQGQKIQYDLVLEASKAELSDLDYATESITDEISASELDSVQTFHAEAVNYLSVPKKEMISVELATVEDSILTVAINEPAAPTPTPQPQIKSVVKHVNADTLNVRSEPTKDSNLVTSIKRGDKVTYYETVGEWARIITWTDKKGYVLAKYLVNSADKVERVIVQQPKEEQKIVASRGNEEKTETAPISAEGQNIADEIITYAKTLLGVPYRWGGYSTSGLDCSGFTKYVFSKFGITLPRSSKSYSGVGTKVSRSELKKGDILLWDTNKNGTIGHVGIYMGDGMFIHASSSKGKVVTRSLASYGEKYMGARRVIK